MSSEIVKSQRNELVDNRLQQEADAFFERVMQAYKDSFKINNDREAKLFVEDKQLLARQLYEYASTRHQITDQSNNKAVKMERSATILLNRLKIFYEWRKERFDKPDRKQVEQQKLIEGS